MQRAFFSKNISDYFVNKECTTVSVFKVYIKLKISTQTSHMKSEFKQFLPVVVLNFLAEKGQRIVECALFCI